MKSSKRKIIEQFFQISDHKGMRSTKAANFEPKTQNQSIHGQIFFGIQLQTFPSKCKSGKFQSKIWNIAKETQFINGGNYTNHRGKKSSCNHSPSITSEPFSSTKSMPKMRPKKVKVFSSLRRLGTNFRHAQGHQRAIALTGSISFFQSTITTVYEVVQHQKTFKKTWKKDSMVFRSNQSFFLIFPRKLKEWKIRKGRE